MADRPMTPFSIAWALTSALDNLWWRLVSGDGDGSFEPPTGPYARTFAGRRMLVSERTCQVEDKAMRASLRDAPPYYLRHRRVRSTLGGGHG